MDTFLKGTLSLAVLILLAGILGVALTPADRAFDLSPWLGSRSAVRAGTGNRLPQVSCPSIHQGQPLTQAQAQSLMQQVSQGATFRNLRQHVKQVLGVPACRLEDGQQLTLVYQVTEDEQQVLITESAQEVTVQWLPSF